MKTLDIYDKFHAKKKSAWNHKVCVSFHDGINPFERDTYDSKPSVTVTVNGRLGDKDNSLTITEMRDLRKVIHDLQLLADINNLFIPDKTKKKHWIYIPKGIEVEEEKEGK